MHTHAHGTRILGFDGLRAIAFILVFFSHKIQFADANPYGEVGVWMFFVLSGFLITRILADARSEIEAGQSTVGRGLRRFYIRRTARIFPPYYGLLAIIAVVSLIVPIDNFWLPEKIAYATYTTNIFVADRGSWIGHFGHFWTLAIEEQFYLLFAPLVLLVPRRHTLAVCVSILALGIARTIDLEVEGATTIAKGISSIANFSLLALGGIIGLNAQRKLPLWLTSGGAQLAVLVLFVSLAALFGQQEDWLLYGKLASAVVAGLLLLQIVQGQGSWLVGALNSPPLRGLGRISYGAYLVHNFIFISAVLFGVAPEGLGFGAQWIVASLVELVLTIAIAAVSWRTMEKPIIAWAARITAREPAAADAARTPPVQSQA